ncbi:hypothetical protein BC937DRAFT_88222 [Endogone sp. FLAS-F59071]|nr:hypothetical protein BC937DRAFT_88222 [Endogone sp. FLAS-F59071]|eukprot:RUS22616.1 hypothetical protein BC937DRAFT_88222 [Endogone sp. FLAS-F59071]
MGIFRRLGVFSQVRLLSSLVPTRANQNHRLRRKSVTPLFTITINIKSIISRTSFLPIYSSRPSAARVVNMSSSAHRFGKIDLDNLNGEKSYGNWSLLSLATAAV